MSTATDLQALLRFLSQDAKVPLTAAISKVRDLQAKGLVDVESIAKSKVDEIKAIFPDEKVAKQVHSAAKRLAKKRAAGEDIKPSPKKPRQERLFNDDVQTPADLEASLALPQSDATEEELKDVVLFTNRAPLVLAMAVTLLKYTMPEQPLSSRLSLAQAYVSISSRSKAVYLGLESGKSAEEEGFGEGQPIVKLMGKDLRVLRRWGYEWKPDKALEVLGADSTQSTLKADSTQDDDERTATTEEREPVGDGHNEVPVWALDLEALKKSNRIVPANANVAGGNHSGLPIHTPQSARAYLLKSFATGGSSDSSAGAAKKKPSAAVIIAEKERNLGHLLRALDLLLESWASTLSGDELDRRTNTWYFKIRPAVEDGVAGWGGKNVLKLSDILALRRIG